MMGEKSGAQGRLFYQFNLDEVVPADHMLRKIDAVLDLSDLRAHLAPFYSHTGRPSIDPELMIRMLLIGYCYGIRSERRLCEEVSLNLAYRWFCRLIDVKHAVIMDVEATPALRTAEVNATKAMIERVERRFGAKPKRLIGDTAYGTAEMLAWMVGQKNIEPHVPVWEKGEREDGIFSRANHQISDVGARL